MRPAVAIASSLTVPWNETADARPHGSAMGEAEISRSGGSDRVQYLCLREPCGLRAGIPVGSPLGARDRAVVVRHDGRHSPNRGLSAPRQSAAGRAGARRGPRRAAGPGHGAPRLRCPSACGVVVRLGPVGADRGRNTSIRPAGDSCAGARAAGGRRKRRGVVRARPAAAVSGPGARARWSRRPDFCRFCRAARSESRNYGLGDLQHCAVRCRLRCGSHSAKVVVAGHRPASRLECCTGGAWCERFRHYNKAE